jgi:hypothetical protein
MRATSLSFATVAVAAIARAASADPVEVRDQRGSIAQPSIVTDTPRYRRRPGPRFMMPLKIDIGAAGANTTRGYAPGIGAAVGIHWASLSPTPTDTDVGVGVFGALLAPPKDATMSTSNDGVAYGGAYLELGHTLSRGDFWRTWASGRGEYLASSAFGDDHKGFGATGRLSAELYVSGVGIEPRGVFLGTYAIGLYVEAGVRDVSSQMGSFHAGAGLTLRTPLVLAP